MNICSLGDETLRDGLGGDEDDNPITKRESGFSRQEWSAPFSVANEGEWIDNCAARTLRSSLLQLEGGFMLDSCQNRQTAFMCSNDMSKKPSEKPTIMKIGLVSSSPSAIQLRAPVLIAE